MGIPAAVAKHMHALCNDPLFDQLVSTCVDVLKKYQLMIHPQHWQFFLVHLKELAERITDQRWEIPVDVDGFPSVVKESMAVAVEICECVGTLPEYEVRLLAVHLELAISLDGE